MMTMMYGQIQTEWPMLPSVAAVYGQRWEVTREWTRPGESGLMAGWDSSVLTCCSVTCSRQSSQTAACSTAERTVQTLGSYMESRAPSSSKCLDT